MENFNLLNKSTINNSILEAIADRYQLAELLGEGGSGSTYRAIRISDGAEVAIKILSLRHLQDWKQLELFEREAQVLAQLSHPQIPKYLEYFHVDTPNNRAFYIVQQLAPGKPLTAWVQSGWRGTEAEVRDIASQLLKILQYLHQQSPPLIHRDIKPHNIVRNDDGKVFLVDFGSVQNVYHNTLSKGCTVAGTYGYMAPEQFRGLAVPASDLYGLGATILYLLTHRSPADLQQERLKISFRNHVNITNHFADWLEMMLELDIAKSLACVQGYRFPSAAVAMNALQKKHRFRIKQSAKTRFPWKGAIVATAVLWFLVPLAYQHRYIFLTIVGLQPKDLSLANNSGLAEKIDSNVVSPDRANTHDNDSLPLTYSINIQPDSLLRRAVEERKPETVKYLLEQGVGNNIHDSNGSTLLHLIIRVQALISMIAMVRYYWIE